MPTRPEIPADLSKVKAGDVPLDFVPSTPKEFAWCCADPIWRLSSGQLYLIKIKPPEDSDDDSVRVVPFKPNRAQKKLIKKLHKRNIILKARQMGFTTFIAILFLDSALFARKNNPVTAAIVAHTEKDAKEIFDDKIMFAYNNLPLALRAVMPTGRNRADSVEFTHNNSKITVSVSFRGSTLTHLHISEFGKICAKMPDRADEVITGSIPAAEAGIIFVESTAEGRAGHFYEMCQRAQRTANLGRRLTNKEFKFHFYPWWDDKNYRMDADLVTISQVEHEYFDTVEAKMNCFIDIEQRAWYISTRDNVYSGQDEKMWQEFPSTPEEPFQISTQGCYYTVQMTKMRKEKRIGKVPFEPGHPVNSFWDIGSSDGCAVWLHQQIGPWHRFIKFFEGWGESYSHFVGLMQEFQRKTECVWGRHYLPHDGAHERQGEINNTSPRTMLENLGLRNVEIVPRVSELQHGISATRNYMSSVLIDEEGCKEGIDHLDNYRKSYNERLQCFSDIPLKDIHTEGADSFRQAAQTFTNNEHTVSSGKRPRRRNKGGMAA